MIRRHAGLVACGLELVDRRENAGERFGIRGAEHLAAGRLGDLGEQLLVDACLDLLHAPAEDRVVHGYGATPSRPMATA